MVVFKKSNIIKVPHKSLYHSKSMKDNRSIIFNGFKCVKNFQDGVIGIVLSSIVLITVYANMSIPDLFPFFNAYGSYKHILRHRPVCIIFLNTIYKQFPIMQYPNSPSIPSFIRCLIVAN